MITLIAPRGNLRAAWGAAGGKGGAGIGPETMFRSNGAVCPDELKNALFAFSHMGPSGTTTILG